MAYPSQPLDATSVPVSSSYVPNDAFYAIQASARKRTDAVGNTYTTPLFEMRTQEDVRTGLAFVASTGVLVTATNPNVVVGASLFNPAASGRTVLVLAARVTQSTATADARLYLTTVDPQLGVPTALTPANLLAGGGTSTLAGLSPNPITSVANNISASVTPAGSLADTLMLPAFSPVEFLPSGMGILLPAGSAHGVAIYTTVTTAGQSFAMTFKWLEY